MTVRPESVENAEVPGRPFAELRERGLLWLINRTVFHPRGYALGLEVDDLGAVTGWQIFGDGTEPWKYADSVPEDELFRHAEAFLASLHPDIERGDR